MASGALDHLGVEEVEGLGEGMADWGSVDAFGCTVSGPTWRRAALASTVPLNLRSRGGTGDTGRTLDICHLPAAGRRQRRHGGQGAVVGAPRAGRLGPEAVRRFLDTHHEVLAARARREVRGKLETGRKHPARRPS